jgi:hypothetical protein
MRERQLFDQLARLRQEQVGLRRDALVRPPDKGAADRLRRIDVESTALWVSIREARAAGRAAHRARFTARRVVDAAQSELPRL